MGVLSLNVFSAEKGVRKTLQFEPDKLVIDVCRQIRQKLPLNNINPEEYGLFRIDDDPTKGVWLDNNRTLEYYLVRNQDQFEYKKKIRQQKIRMLDKSTKIVQVDESQPVGRLMVTICTKIGIANHEEYSLVRDKDDPITASTLNLREERSRSQEPGDRQKGIFMGTLNRKKEKKIEQLKSTLHTDEELPWVDHGRTLREQGISEEETLVLRRKFFYSDTNVDSRDPVQLNLLYVQCRDGILRGQHPVSRETACDLAALMAQAEYGDFPRNNPKFNIEGRDLLPKEYGKNKDNDKTILEKYKELSGLSELEAKSKYVHLCRGLKTYGVTFFVVKEKMRGKNKLVPRLLGVNKDSVMRVDEKTKDILKEWPLEQVRKWAPGPKTFTLDFGDYQDGYYAVQTQDGDKIAQLIAGYIDIILKKRQTRDHLGIEGDEGSTMLEDVVTPARATLVSHGQIGTQYPQDGHVALRGVMRTPQSQNGYGIHGAQYGAVSGEITTNDTMGRAQRSRIIDTYQQPQRALIGTIETTIRAVERAEEELEKEPEIEIPKFHDDLHARKWVEEQVAVNKENVNERLAAMGAATAQVVQWTAVQEEYDDRVGTAIATIGSNLPDVGRNIRDLSYLIEERRSGDLVEAARRLCGAFGDFLNSVNPEHQEKRQTVLAAASKVGEFSQRVVNTMEDKTIEEETFHEQLVTKAKNVATSTAQLVLRAKTISAECDEKQLQDNVIHSATQCAFATSQLVACTRVVAPTMESNACQQQLTNAAKHVSTAVDDLLVDAKAACQRSPDGQRSYRDLYEAASQVTHALDGLLDHVKTSPRIRKTVEEEEYHKLLRTTNRLIAHQGPSEDLTREARKVIRHSQVLQEQLETEAFERPEQRDKLLEAARRVATATSQMIDATRECESRPTEAESEMALRKAAEEMASVTHESTSEKQARYIMERLEQAAKQTAYEATQAIAAANASKEVIQSKNTQEILIYECTETAGHMSGMINSIRESANAPTPAEKFRAQSRLIRDATHILEPATRLVEVSSSAVAEVQEPHLANNLQQASHGLSTALAELRTALNDARQLNFSQQLFYTEDLIRELDSELQTIHKEAQAGTLRSSSGSTAGLATSKLMSAARQVGSGVAQLVSASTSHDEQHIGASAVEAAQGLRVFTSAVKEVVATRKDIELDSLIVESRSVVHDSGRVFDRVREHAPPAVLAESAKQVSVSLKKVIACLPDTQHVEKAINQVRTIGTSATVREPDVRVAAIRLVESTSNLQANVRQPGESEAVDVFVRCYTDFHTSAIAAIKQQQIPIQERAQKHEELESVRSEAIELLARIATPSEASYLSQASTHFTETVNRFVTHISVEQPLEKECDAALRKLQSVRHLTEQAIVPLSESSYWGSLSTITDNSRRLGDAITEVARAVKTNDVNRTCESIRSYASTMCSMTEAAAHSAYLVGVAHPKSVRGQQALIDAGSVKKSVQVVKQICERIEEKKYQTREQLMEDGTIVAKHTSVLANLCRNASEKATNVNVKKQFINCAKEIASCTADLISAVKDFDKQPNAQTESACSSTATTLRQAAENLESFVDNPAFAAVPARISPEGRSAQIPVLASSRQMLDASCEMVSAMRQLAGPNMDTTAWQRVADQSRVVSESIKRLVTSINDATPGVLELERTIQLLENLLVDVDRAAMEAAQNPPQPAPAEEKRTHQHLLHVTQALAEKVNSLRTAAVEKGEELGHCAEEHWALIEPLAISACKAAAIASDSRRQAELFNQCKTVIEAEVALMTACLNSRGNPAATEHHRAVDEYSAQLKDALAELRGTVNRISSEQGTIQGLVETISHSIASSDAAPTTAEGSFADAQTRMTKHLEAIRSTATDIPFAEAERLNTLVLQLSENYRNFVVDSNQAVKLITSPNLGQKLKVAGQKLGTACIETVKTADLRKKYPQDQGTQKELTDKSRVVIERVDEVLAALHEGSKGTQACINAANTVSGIIGDLDTTILFATSGSLNPTEAKDFSAHREAILKTAKALVEDTKALVAGAASNQEQLAVAAQNAVRTIVNLSDAVKNGATCLSSDNQEAQVMVIHSVRDVCSALSILIQATKNAVGRSLHDPAMNNLKEAAKTMVTNVTSLLKTVKSVEDKQNQGTLALDAAIAAIGQEISHYDRETGDHLPGTSSISPDALAVAGQRVADVAHRIVGASQSMTQSDVIAAANIARAAVGDVLTVTRVAAANAETTEGRYRILDCGRDVAVQLNALLVSLHKVLRSQDPSSRQALVDASRLIAKSVRDLVGCSDLLRGEEWGEADVIASATAGAEKELLVAANSIQQASVKLAELRPRHQPAELKMEPRDTFDGQILYAATSITNAVHTLVKAASVAQRELVAQGRLEPSSRSGDDYQWSEGLISAARFVVAAVHQLCDAANALVQGQSSEEKLISAAKQVASSTAQLLIACNVKADIDSQARKRLQAAGHAVKTATERLVESARHVVVQDERNIIIADKMVHGIAQVMDAQEQVAKKEKELLEARKQLATIHKARYERGGSPQ